MLELVDTHCHIQSIAQTAGERITRELWAREPQLTADNVVTGAARAGVTRLICVGCSLDDSRLVTDFVQEHEGCWAAIGIHPHEAKHHLGEEASRDLAALTARPKVVAIGECGLDFYYDHSPKEAQLAALDFQLRLAVDKNLPVIFHVREAFDDFWPVFDSHPGLRGVLHSYTDSAANLKKALERGLYVGVNGIATFAKDPSQLEVYKSIPLSNLLLETDSPFLSPKPHRGKINRPERVADVAAFLAELRGEGLEDLAAATTANARKLFGV